TDPTGETETGGLACEDKAPPGHEVETACFPVPDGLQSCEECGPDCQQTNMNGAITQDPDFCWAEQLMVLCGPDDGVPQVPGSCCYTASYNGILCEGRPCIVDGAPRVASLVARADWSDPDIAPTVAGLDATTRAALASAWREDGLMEHASIAAFSRFVLQLMAVAAPAWLVEETQRALDDEIEHARLCFGLGDAYGGDHQGPGPLEVEDLLEETAEITDVAVATVVEGCVAETIAALLARAALERARDPEVRRALARIAEDEARHATLAWRFVQWAIEEGGAPVREAVRAAFATTAARPPAPRSLPADVDAAAMGDHGRLDAAAQIAVIEAGLAEVIGPCAAALVDPASRPARALEILPFPSGQVH
ncbi:MAG: ferritin-like domain-containing protein, partial [Myxococcales bacterium]|nr:ferritin-like domain-containing protein [Myxococcales bacterium]